MKTEINVVLGSKTMVSDETWVLISGMTYGFDGAKPESGYSFIVRTKVLFEVYSEDSFNKDLKTITDTIDSSIQFTLFVPECDEDMVNNICF